LALTAPSRAATSACNAWRSPPARGVAGRCWAISPETYQPSLEGIDLGFDVSASDWIRIIWAYLLGLMEVSRGHETNHPKILVFDEPGQQSTDPVSLDQLLKRAERSREFDEQVILATSEPTELLEPMLAGLDLHYVRVEGKLLKRF